MSSRPVRLAAILVCLSPVTALGQSDGEPDNSVQCVAPAGQASTRFAELQEKAMDLNRRVCLALFNGDFDSFEETQKGLYNGFGLEAIETATEQLANSSVTDWRVPFGDWLERISTSEFRNKDIREMSVTVNLAGTNVMFFGNTASAAEIGDALNTSCGPQRNQSCLEVLKDLAVAINVYNDSYANFALQSTRTRLGELSGEWDAFLENGRSQTLLDLVATTLLERSHFKKDYLVGPPKRQWALLHPSLVIEHAEAAMPGDKDEMAVAIEWLGVNWWSDASPLFDVPFGIALASVYSDRPGMKSVGHGVMLHLDNRYSIGWATRSGDSSYYLTVDLLKFIEDKEQQFNRYKNEMLDFN